MKTVLPAVQLLFALTIFQPVHADPLATAVAPLTERLDVCEQNLTRRTPIKATLNGLVRFDRFGEKAPDASVIVELLERELAQFTGAHRRTRGAATIWFTYLYQNYLGRSAPDFGFRVVDALAIFDRQQDLMKTAFATFVGDLRAELAKDAAAVAVLRQALHRFDVFGDQIPTGDQVVDLLEREVAAETGFERTRLRAAIVWLEYLYRAHFGRTAPELNLHVTDQFLIFPIQGQRLVDAWQTFTDDLRRVVSVAPASAAAPLVLVPKSEPTVAPEIKSAPPVNVPPVTREVKPWTGPRPGRSAIDTVLSVAPVPRNLIIFLSQRYLRTVKMSEAQALDRYFDLAWAEFLPGRPRRGHDYPKNAAKLIDRGHADEKLVALVRSEWQALRQGLLEDQHARVNTPVVKPTITFGATFADEMDGRSSVDDLDDMNDALGDQAPTETFLRFVMKFTAHGKVSDQNGLYLVTLGALFALEPNVGKPVYIAARRYLKGSISLTDWDYSGVRYRRPASLERFAKVIRLFQWTLNSPRLQEPLTAKNIEGTIADFEAATRLSLSATRRVR